MFLEMCSVLTVGKVKRVLLQVEECRCGLWHARDWDVCVCVCVCIEVGKMAKDIGMTIRKGIVVSFLPYLVAFWGFHPICSFIF